MSESVRYAERQKRVDGGIPATRIYEILNRPLSAKQETVEQKQNIPVMCGSLLLSAANMRRLTPRFSDGRTPSAGTDY